MNTLNYIGCKKTLLKNIFYVIKKNIEFYNEKTFSDLFAGTGVVGFYFSDKCKNIISNDLEYYSYIINYALLKCSYTNKLELILNNLNDIESVEGLIYKNFSPNENCERMFFTNKNAKKCDAIRQEIEKMKNNNSISKNEYYFLLASLLVSIDKVANTASVYGAYLKKFKKSSLKNIILFPIHKNKNINKNNKIYNCLTENIILHNKFDIVYLDPPYNHRQYSGNYSPLNYISLYDNNIKLKGKTGLIENYNKSCFSSKINVKKTFEDMIKNLKCEFILLSYNNEGILQYDDIKNTLLKKGSTILYKIKYKKFKSNKNDKNINFVEEYLWFVNTKKNSKFNTENIKLIV